LEEDEKPERDSLRATEHYQFDPYHHYKRERKSKEVRVDLPHFHGSNDIETFPRLGDEGWTIVWMLPCEWREKISISHP